MKNTKEIQIIATLLSLPKIGPSKVNTFLKKVRERNIPLGSLLTNKRLLELLLPNYLSDKFVSLSLEVEKQILSLKKQGWDVLSVNISRYPQKLHKYLGNSAPPLLFYRGNINLLKLKVVGFCGSRQATNAGLSVAKNCVYQLVQKNIVTISGYASGIDTYVHKVTLQAKGSTIIVLPTGVLEFKIKKELQEYWDWEKVLVISQFLPNSKWSVHNAMTRNKTIVALSDSIILIEAKSKGGSMDAGLTALRMGKPLYAPVYKDMPPFASGNKILIQKGAFRLNRDINSPPNSFQANLANLYSQLEINL